MNDSQKSLNTFLVKTFNKILRQEERGLEQLSCGKLSVKEFHVLEAIAETAANNSSNMRTVAKALDVTMGTLTVAVKTLETKGYVKRFADEADKRSVKLALTLRGEQANQKHIEFHRRLIETITAQINKKQQSILAESLQILEKFFDEGVNNND